MPTNMRNKFANLEIKKNDSVDSQKWPWFLGPRLLYTSQQSRFYIGV